MTRYILKRIALMILLLLGMSFIVFGSMYLAPGDPASMVAGPSATEEDIANIRVSLGLDKPFLVQYLLYLKRLVTLDLGVSYTSRQPILNEILVRLPHTLNLACAAMLILAHDVQHHRAEVSALGRFRLWRGETHQGLHLSAPSGWRQQRQHQGVQGAAQ